MKLREEKTKFSDAKSWLRKSVHKRGGKRMGIRVGATVFECGGFSGEVKPVVVTEQNKNLIAGSWLTWYFPEFQEAERRTRKMHGDYEEHIIFGL